MEAYAKQLAEFVREHEMWAAPIMFALAFGESLAFISLLIPAWSFLVAIGALIGPSGIISGRSGSAARSARPSAIGCPIGSDSSWRSRSTTSGRFRASGDDPQRRSLRDQVGSARDLRRALFRATASHGAIGRRHFPHASNEIPNRQFHIGLRMGRGAAFARRCHRYCRRAYLAHVLKKTARRFLDAQLNVCKIDENYFTAATPACETTSSCEPVPPLAPIAPTTLPPPRSDSRRAKRSRRQASVDKRRRGPCRAIFRTPLSTAIACRRARLVLRNADGRILAIVLLLEINEIAGRTNDRDAHCIPISLFDSAIAAVATFLAVSILIGSP